MREKTPIWRVIYDTLKAEIVDGSFKAGEKLPTEKAFAERFGVNRHTVRRALAELSQSGVIAVRRGSGAYVADGVIHVSLGARPLLSRDVAAFGRTPSHEVVAAEARPADDRVAEHLRLPAGGQVLYIESISMADDTPVCVMQQHFPAERFPTLADALRETGCTRQALTRFGVVDYTRAWTRIAAAAPSRAIAKLLRQPENAPVLRTEALSLDMAGQPIEYAVGCFAGHRAAL
ncbi:MAG: phosphonate metabolism transcriptional regulator PhnF, partial [Pseudomonadota bacterium]